MNPGTRPRILLLGATGQVGRELLSALAPLGKIAAPPRAQADLADPASLRAAVRRVAPALVVNAAAYTAVDRAEAEPELAHAVNARGPGVLAEEAARAGALLVHFSTDYVFGGPAERPWREDDAPSPVNTYGRTKLQGENAVAAAGGAHLVLRASWIFGTHGSNLLRRVLDQAREREELRMVDDQTGSPAWSRMVARATAAVLARLREGDGFRAEGVTGVYHLASAGQATRYAFACAALACDPARGGHRCRTVRPVRSDAFPGLAPRPAYTVLDTGKLARTFGVSLPHWREQLALCLR